MGYKESYFKMFNFLTDVHRGIENIQKEVEQDIIESSDTTIITLVSEKNEDSEDE